MMIKSLAIAVAATVFASVGAVIRNRCEVEGVVAISWDDGPAEYTLQLLEILKAKNVKVTFHVTTQYLTDPKVQSQIRKIAQDGHLIGLRTEPSWDLFKMSSDQITASIARQANVLAQFIGYYPKFVRLPYQKYDDRVLAAVEKTGAIVSTHNLDTNDYSGDSDLIIQAYQVALELAGPGAGSFLSIQHDGILGSVNVTPRVIDLIKKLGFRMVKLDECFSMGDLTKNKTPLAGGNAAPAPMEIDSSSNGSSGSSNPSGSSDSSEPIKPIKPIKPIGGSGSNNNDNKNNNNGKVAGQSSSSSALSLNPTSTVLLSVLAIALMHVLI